MDWKLEVSGAVSQPLSLSYNDLVERPQSTLKDIVAPHCTDGKDKNTWVGPSLADLLFEAGISAQAGRITFTGQDGYTQEIAVGEGANAVLALKRDGKWISPQDKGPVYLIVPDKTANFWVGRLQKIVVSE